MTAIVARGARSLPPGALLKIYGEPIREFIEKRLGLIAGVIAAILILLYLVLHYLHASS